MVCVEHLVGGVAAESLPHCFADRCEKHGPDPWILEEVLIGCRPRQGQEPVGFVGQPARRGGYCGGRFLGVPPCELDKIPIAVVEVGLGGRDLVDRHNAAHEGDPGDPTGHLPPGTGKGVRPAGRVRHHREARQTDGVDELLHIRRPVEDGAAGLVIKRP